MKNLESSLYHRRIGFPSDVNLKLGILELTYSRHALAEAAKDQYGFIRLPKVLNTNELDQKAFEIQISPEGKLEKIVYRLPYSRENDLILVLSVDRSHVITVWLNRKTDMHRTLNRARYQLPNRRAA